MFENIYGHEKITSYLERMLKQNNLPSSLIFHGQKGVGKEMTAVEVARYLNCDEEKTSECSCLSCRKIENGEHSDVFVYEPEGQSFKIDTVRDILDRSDRGHFEGAWKVFILKDVQKITPEGADALLKTLEDGREDTLFILISENYYDIIDTIKSRALDLYFSPLSSDVMKRILEDTYSFHDKLDVAINLSEGSIDRALYYLEGEGFRVRKDIIETIQSLPKVSDHALLDLVDDYSDNLDDFVHTLYLIFYDLLRYSYDISIMNSDIESYIDLMYDRWGSFVREAFEESRRIFMMRRTSISYEHQVKSSLLTIKSILRP